MALRNRSKFAILGILNIAPGSGYDIKKYCDTVISNIWSENYGHIYPMLKSLEKEGLIEQVSQENAGRKIQYRTTQTGKEELMSWLCEETVSQPLRSEFMLKFLFSNNLPKENGIRMLTEYREQQRVKLDGYYNMMNELDSGIKEISKEREMYLRATLRRGILSGESMIEWCDETTEIFRK